MQRIALDLFERHGYAAVTVDQIAAAAGVSHMTFFRHFTSKERVLLDDPFDPVLAAAVSAQPRRLPVIERVARGVVAATDALDEYGDESVRRRLRVSAAEPALQAGMQANNTATIEAIAATGADDSDRRDLRVAAAACIGAATVALLEWADQPGATLGGAIRSAMALVCPATGGRP
jgi:AcrR family transcriptional regulator